jgi:release factor glutamine methyltransferase
VSLDEGARQLAAAGVENPRGEARLLLAPVMGVSKDETLSGALTISPEQHTVFEAVVARRAAREPLAYITGRREFWSLSLSVGPGVLVPRPDTETLIEEALRIMPDHDAPLRIADLGTGSGAILLAALAAFPNATGTGFESSPEALAYARANAAAQPRADMRLADWSQAAGEAFDLIFCNPPYIPTADIESLDPEVRLHEPRAALDGGQDGLDAYRGLAELLPRALRPGGCAVLEIGIGQAAAMEPLFAGLEFMGIAPDLAGVPRAVSLAAQSSSFGVGIEENPSARFGVIPGTGQPAQLAKSADQRFGQRVRRSAKSH